MFLYTLACTHLSPTTDNLLTEKEIFLSVLELEMATNNKIGIRIFD